MSFEVEFRKVISDGFCVGCGACAALDPAISIRFDDVGRLQAVLPDDHMPSVAAVASCPFTGKGPDEDDISSAIFGSPDLVQDDRIGRHLATFAGWVEENGLRAQASSGGIATWLQCELLAQGEVDAVVNVTPRTGQGDAPLFSFRVAQTPEEIVGNAKTRYFPVEMSGVISHIIQCPARYAVIGTPCFAKALRLAALQSPELGERLRFVIGIVCGHLKSAAFAKSLAWQCGIDPEGIKDIDFRAKLEGRPASRYGVRITGNSRSCGKATTVTRPMEGLVGANWGHGLFKYKSCEFCDDVLGETADVVVGDAWLPAYDDDHRGANIVVVRHSELLRILKAAGESGRLHLDVISADDVALSQAGGLRHRRDGLAYRLWMTDQAGQWRPKKRVRPHRDHLTPGMRRIHEARYKLGQMSHDVWRDAIERGDPKRFMNLMMPMLRSYDRMMKPSLLRRALGLVERMLDAALFKIGLRR